MFENDEDVTSNGIRDVRMINERGGGSAVGVTMSYILTSVYHIYRCMQIIGSAMLLVNKHLHFISQRLKHFICNEAKLIWEQI